MFFIAHPMTDVPHFPHYVPSTQYPPLCSPGLHHTDAHDHVLYMYVPWLLSSASLSSPKPPASPLAFVSISHGSMPLVLCCSSVYFGH